jgi:hypothetical protein
MAERFKLDCGGGGCCPEAVVEGDGTVLIVDEMGGGEGLPAQEVELVRLTRAQADQMTRELLKRGYGK